MVAEQTETAEAAEALDWAVAAISVGLERLVAKLPAGVDLTQVAFDLVHGVEALGSDGSNIATIFHEGDL